MHHVIVPTESNKQITLEKKLIIGWHLGSQGRKEQDPDPEPDPDL
jgi:hypothetical protein